jgi:calcium-dependent protein kinase
MRIIHRDIKPDNILIHKIEGNSDYAVRIADFGLAAFTPEKHHLTHKCGTAGFCAPELCNRSNYSYKADIFSLGAVLFKLMTGKNLFPGTSNDEVLLKNMVCDTTNVKGILQEKGYSLNFIDAVRWMLEADPANRPNAKKALTHDWFK